MPLSPRFISSAPLSPRFPLSAPLSRRFFSSTPLSPRFLLSAPSSPHFPLSFYLGRSPITMRPFSLYLSKKKQNPFRVLFFIRQVAWNNLITRDNLTTRETLFTFYSSYRAGRLEQLDHSRNPFRVLFFIGQVAWNNLTTRETLVALFFSFSSGRSPGTIWPLAKPFSRFTLPIGQVAWNN